MSKYTEKMIPLIKEEIEKNKSISSLCENAKKTEGDEQTIYAFAACYYAVKEGLGLTAFDEQLMAGLCLDEGKIIEMATGEGKTIAAVFAAYINALRDRRVHILTFNDYLAKRDYNWMKPVYDLLGINISYIVEGMEKAEKKAAYSSQVVYVTAKECGFDFLRDFVATDIEDMVHSGFDFAIVDEADSILIDEARLPLVIAGNIEVTHDERLSVIYDLVKGFTENCYDIDIETENIFLTETGARLAEQQLGCENIYSEESSDDLSMIVDCLTAEYLKQKDIDYIVKDGQIRIIDQFTGRVSVNRHYQGNLQAAVEAKEGLVVTDRGTVMGTVPLQFFVRQYKKLSGMTGTAESAMEEFYQLYDLRFEKIPTHVPSGRIDRDLMIYTHSEAKWNAVADRVYEANKIGQPVLVGTYTIEESEKLAAALLERKINCAVLNAKNDQQEAEIIKNAGAFGTVTISTNMAGRGVDIKLGGADESSREKVIEAGGLLIIGTHMGESSRITRQLRGRAGRQGDLGESVFYVSINDEIMNKYGLKTLVQQKHWIDKEQDEPIMDKVIQREVARIQRIAEGDNLELRKRLLKFTMIGEKHRDVIFGARLNFITGKSKPKIWQENCPELYDEAVEKFGEQEVDSFQTKLIISVINDFWREYLEYTSYLREGIHLTRIAGKNPADEYNIACEEFFLTMEAALAIDMAERLEEILELDDINDYEIKTPSSTWTYTLNESGDELLKKSFIEAAMTDHEISKFEQENAEYDDDKPEDGSDTEETDQDKNDGDIRKENPEKQGFFRKLFGKKD